ncbi:HAMP domain-containing histidine kinase [Formicincola oecophyllae]|uniref:histidine kinase n=2 Tax=Formicincola oecophyllae TaxID=2558361 RepID=A0A4Y6UE65_9PROT|nr:HAMP domain-containing histidine kinase [Formicincola oecophyllae]
MQRLSRHLHQHWPVRSVGLTFAMVYGGVFVVSAIMFLSFTWWNTARLLNDHIEHAITHDASDLLARWATAGSGGLSHALRLRIEQDIGGDAIYLLISPQGQAEGGNIDRWPVQVAGTKRFYQLSLRHGGGEMPVMVHSWALPDGQRLLVGRDVKALPMMRKVMTQAFLWCLLMVVLLALGGALIVQTLFRHMVTAVARTTAAIAEGDLSRRIPLNGSETDLVAVTVNRMLTRIDKLMRGVRQVSNAIAHDLRTPITRARTRLEDAALHAKTTQELHAAIEEAVADCDHITAIFDALLRIAQIEAGARRQAFAPANPTQLLRSLAELYEAVTEDAGLKLLLYVPELPDIVCDQHMVSQAVANLLDNAIKFSPPHGTITLSARLVRQPPGPTGVHARADGPRQALEITVTDAGPGMLPADMARATARFFRAEAARSTPGSGLGLSLVHAIAGLHHGEIRLASGQHGTMDHPLENTRTDPSPATLPALPGLRATLVLPLQAPGDH